MITDKATLLCAKRVERQIFDVDHFVVGLTLSNTRMRNRQYAKRWCASCRVVLFFFFGSWERCGKDVRDCYATDIVTVLQQPAGTKGVTARGDAVEHTVKRPRRAGTCLL